MRDGLGLRFAFMGPMETIHLNAMGLKKYCETYGETIYNVSKTMGDIPSAWLMRNEEDKAKVLFSFNISGFFLQKGPNHLAPGLGHFGRFLGSI